MNEEVSKAMAQKALSARLESVLKAYRRAPGPPRLRLRLFGARQNAWVELHA